MNIGKRFIVVATMALAGISQMWGGNVAGKDEERKTLTREEYIERYAPLAVEQQALFGIPASITLAQGLLESSNGNSRLAVEANNHFGIKCGKDWEGDNIRHDDDALQECFRAYKSVEDSYIDHSLILMERPWYQPLFELEMKDYKGWAHGLKKAGYATNPKYAYLLIDIIEKYELHKYDHALLADYQPQGATPKAEEVITKVEEVITKAEEPVEAPVEKPTVRVDIDSYGIATQTIAGYGIYSEEGRRYVIAIKGGSLSQIAAAVGVSERQLRLINDLTVSHKITAGEKIFIER